MQQQACHEMKAGEVLNAVHTEFPLHQAVLYGSKLECAKFSKRLSCAIKHLPIRVAFAYNYDTVAALEAGVQKDPTLILDDVIFLEGLVQAETITEAFEKLVRAKKG